MKTLIGFHNKRPYIFYLEIKHFCYYGFKHLKGSGKYRSNIITSKWLSSLDYILISFFDKLKAEGFTFYFFKNIDEYYLEKLANNIFKHKTTNNELEDFLRQFRERDKK